MDNFFGYSKMLIEEGIAKIVDPFNDEDIYINTGLKLEDVEFYYEEAKQCNGKVLELGCGYGRILLALLKRGIDIDGLEKSKELVKYILNKSKELELQTKVYIDHMQNVKNIKCSYDLVICPNYVMDYIRSYDEFVELLKSIYCLLGQNGKLIFNIDIKETDEKNYGPAISCYSFNKEEKKAYMSIIETRVIDDDCRLCNLTTYISQGEQTSVFVSFTKEFRWDFGKLINCITSSGFEVDNLYRDYDKSEFKSGRDSECVLILKK